MDMRTSLHSGVRRVLPMLALFVAAFAATWTVQSRSVGAATTGQLMAPPVPVLLAAPLHDVHWSAAPDPETQLTASPEPAPTLAQLTLDADTDTQAEARTLVGLLDAEGRSDD